MFCRLRGQLGVRRPSVGKDASGRDQRFVWLQPPFSHPGESRAAARRTQREIESAGQQIRNRTAASEAPRAGWLNRRDVARLLRARGDCMPYLSAWRAISLDCSPARDLRAVARYGAFSLSRAGDFSDMLDTLTLSLLLPYLVQG